LAGGKGGFGSNLRAAGKQKLTDNFDACRDLQGRRIRHKSAADKLAEWKSESQERELERVAMRHLREVSKAEHRQKLGEVDVQSVRKEAQAALDGVQNAVAFALQNGTGIGTSVVTVSTGRDLLVARKKSLAGDERRNKADGFQTRKKQRRMIDPLDYSDDDSDSDRSDVDSKDRTSDDDLVPVGDGPGAEPFSKENALSPASLKTADPPAEPPSAPTA